MENAAAASDRLQNHTDYEAISAESVPRRPKTRRLGIGFLFVNCAKRFDILEHPVDGRPKKQ